MLKKTVRQIVASGNHYVIQVKKNQKNLYEYLEQLAKTSPSLDVYHHMENGHGRKSQWRVSVFEVQSNEIQQQWQALRRGVHVQKRSVQKGISTVSNRYYISDLEMSCAQKFHEGIRGHWKIENRLHWVKDVQHGEDRNRIRTKHGPVNTAIFSTIAINISRIAGFQSILESKILFASNIRKLFKLIRT